MSLQLTLLRPDDLLNLEVEAINLQVDNSDPDHPGLVPVDGQQPAYLVVTFPPQTIEETAYFETSPIKPKRQPADPDGSHASEALAPPGQVGARLGGLSQLVFQLPEDLSTFRLPFSTQGLLNWSGLKLVVAPLADIPPTPTPEQLANAPDPRPPEKMETAIELPYQIILSPTHAVEWLHEVLPVNYAGWTELWHTRLALSSDQGPVELSRDNKAPLRVIWTPGFAPGQPPDRKAKDLSLGRTAMSPNDRYQLVILNTGFHGYFTGDFVPEPFVPQPVWAEQLMLSPLGGWLRSRGNWTPPYTILPRRRPIGVEGLPIFEMQGFHPAAPIGAPAGGGEAAGGGAGGGGAAGGGGGAAGQNGEGGAAVPAAPGALGQLFAAGSPSAAAAMQRVGLPFKRGEILNLSEWVHVAVQGRDDYVRIVYEGHLCPFGHHASLVKVTERRFVEVNGVPAAYLLQHMYIVVREPEKVYSHAPLPHNGNSLPIRRIRLTTLVTPNIIDPYAPPAYITGTDASFWIMVDGSGPNALDFPFHMVTEDIAGGQNDYSTALIFVPDGETQFGKSTDSPPAPTTVLGAYNGSGDRRACAVPGQKITYAQPAAGAAAGNTALTTRALYFNVTDAPGAPDFGFFLPELYRFDVQIPQVEQILGSAAVTSVSFTADYLDKGFANAGGVFARVVKDLGLSLDDDTLKLEFSADKAGGFATPNMSLSSLSRDFGPLAGTLSDALNNTFDPSQYFPVGAALLFGSLPLGQLIKTGSIGAHAPKMLTTSQDIPHGKNLITTLEWEPEVTDNPVKLGILTFQRSDATQLSIQARLEKPVLAGGAPPGTASSKTEFEGTLKDFRLDFADVIALHFSAFHFHSGGGQKLDVDVHLDGGDPVKFEGDLDFVNALSQILPPGMFGDGPSLDITPVDVHVGFGIALPPASVAVFSLQNLSFSAGLTLPFFDGKPLVDFAFAERHRPFLLTVAFLGGGGYFHLQLDTKHITLLEAALEFGASLNLDLGVASGGVHIMAGIYFAMGDSGSTLTGYLRCGGELSVLGLISVSLEFVLSFTYHNGKCSGRATLTVEVDIAFFSVSVELTVERSFGSNGGDPTFGDLFDTPELWDAYAGAFA